MVPTRRQLLSVGAGAALTALAGCLDQVADDLPENESATTHEACSATAPPDPTPGEGLPDSRSYPEGPPEFTDSAVTEFLEQYERAFKYNTMLADFVADEQCLKYLEIYVVDSETTVKETEQGYEAEVTTQGSYTGTTCPADSETTTGTGVPHADLAKMPAHYRVTRRALTREETVYECW